MTATPVPYDDKPAAGAQRIVIIAGCAIITVMVSALSPLLPAAWPTWTALAGYAVVAMYVGACAARRRPIPWFPALALMAYGIAAAACAVIAVIATAG